MATPADDKNAPQTSDQKEVQPTLADQHEANPETNKGISPPSVFVNSEPMREDQIQNAIKFLSHPRVKGSPVMHRRSFLEKKGLTKEEIDEAFRRVPDSNPTVSAAQPATTPQESQMTPVSNVQPQVTSQNVQSSAASAGAYPNQGILIRSGFHWSHALAAIGLLAISGAGTAVVFKRSIVPRLKSWIRKVVFEEEQSAKKISGKPSLEEEAAAAAKAAAAAAADVARASQEMLISKEEGELGILQRIVRISIGIAAAADVARASQEMLISKEEDRKFLSEFMNLFGVQVQEMKSLSNAIRKLEGNTPSKVPLIEEEQRFSVNNSRQSNVNGTADFYSGRSSPPTSNAEPSAAPHPKSYMEIMAMIQRGEKPSNIREVNDMPPNPNQPLPTPQLAPRPKPWEVAQNQSSFPQNLQSNQISDGVNYNSSTNGFTNQANGDNAVPWWQKKNARISEIENENEFKTAYVSANSARPVQRPSWVPPQPPPVAIPEAAAAIRQPKKPQSQISLTDEQLLASDELQRVTKISEAGGILDNNSLNSEMNTHSSEVYVDAGSSSLSEIQEEQEAY